jgi:hypothetical protein
MRSVSSLFPTVLQSLVVMIGEKVKRGPRAIPIDPKNKQSPEKYAP